MFSESKFLTTVNYRALLCMQQKLKHLNLEINAQTIQGNNGFVLFQPYSGNIIAPDAGSVANSLLKHKIVLNFMIKCCVSLENDTGRGLSSISKWSWTLIMLNVNSNLFQDSLHSKP